MADDFPFCKTCSSHSSTLLFLPQLLEVISFPIHQQEEAVWKKNYTPSTTKNLSRSFQFSSPTKNSIWLGCQRENFFANLFYMSEEKTFEQLYASPSTNSGGPQKLSKPEKMDKQHLFNKHSSQQVRCDESKETFKLLALKTECVRKLPKTMSE